MPTQKVTTAIFIDKYHPKAKSKCAVSLRVTYGRKKKYYATPVSLTPEEFKRTQGAKPRNDYKETSLKLQSYENKAVAIIKDLSVFTWAAFEKRYLNDRAANDTLDIAFAGYIKELKEEGRIGTAYSYQNAQISLSKFHPGARFGDVTPDFLKKYEKWMLGQNRSVTTIGIYLRSLRTLFSNASAEGLLSKDLYPFGKKKYEIPTGNNVKKALTLNDIAAIYYSEPEPGSTAEMARDYWIFMYLCNGINVKDMCLLKHENVSGDMLEFVRAKTIRTKRKVEPIRVVLNEDAKNIIKKWGNPPSSKNPYIFPVLGKGLTPVRERQLIQQLTQVINSHMKTIAGDLELTNEVTTYSARHSFATILQRSGASTEFISEALGHSSVKTTQNYLAGFEDESKREKVKALTAFKS